MLLCPVCEHRQPGGEECAQCGKRFTAAVTPDVPTSAMPGLEETSHAAPVGAPPPGTIPDLEPTASPETAEVASAPIAELERHHADVGQVSVAPIPDVDTGRAPVIGTPTPAQAPDGSVTCRYCRNVQRAGMLCDRCGMRLPRVPPSRVGANAEQGDPELVACGECSNPRPRGSSCRACGARAPSSESD